MYTNRLARGANVWPLFNQGMTRPPLAVNRLAPTRLSERVMPHHLFAATGSVYPMQAGEFGDV